jgi:hypothetical protein
MRLATWSPSLLLSVKLLTLSARAEAQPTTTKASYKSFGRSLILQAVSDAVGKLPDSPLYSLVVAAVQRCCAAIQITFEDAGKYVSLEERTLELLLTQGSACVGTF